MTGRKRARRLLLAAVALLFVGGGAAWYVGGMLIAPFRRAAGTPPAALAAESVAFRSESGATLHGWLSRGETGRGAVLLLHGVRASRAEMVPRALFLHALGYSVLLIDLQAHGESIGERITFGDLESRDAAAALNFLRQKLPGERLGIVAVSLGAAAVVLAETPLYADAVVLESMYPTIEQAVSARLRLRLGAAGEWCAPLLIAQVAPRIRVDPKRLRPIDAIAQLGAPLLMIHGVRDRHTPLAEAESVFAVAAEPKTFWPVEGAAHVDLHRFAKAEYEARVGAFLASHLRAGTRSGQDTKQAGTSGR